MFSGEVELRIEVLHHFTPPVSRSSSADSAGGQAVSDVSRRASASSASTTIGPIDTARTGEDTLQEALEAAHRKRVWRSLQKGSPGGGGGLKKTTSGWLLTSTPNPKPQTLTPKPILFHFCCSHCNIARVQLACSKPYDTSNLRVSLWYLYLSAHTREHTHETQDTKAFLASTLRTELVGRN